MTEIVPKDSRYVPMTQQPSCCVPTCIAMIMYKLGIPLIPQEELGYHLGLIVRDENKYLFWNPRTGERPPTGYGTQIYKKEFSINKAFKNLNIPLEMSFHSIDEFSTDDEISQFISKRIHDRADMLVCFDHNQLNGDGIDGGHVCVIDQIFPEDGIIRLIDPQKDQPKWREIEIKRLIVAMQKHGSKHMGGIWEFVLSNQTD